MGPFAFLHTHGVEAVQRKASNVTTNMVPMFHVFNSSIYKRIEQEATTRFTSDDNYTAFHLGVYCIYKRMAFTVEGYLVPDEIVRIELYESDSDDGPQFDADLMVLDCYAKNHQAAKKKISLKQAEEKINLLFLNEDLIRRIRNFNDFIVDVVDEDVYEDTDDD
jgi:hypothetical protein